jgi:3-dehydrotetronate 4-kinase
MKASNSNQNTDMPFLLGSVADDFTGASDLADTLVASGLSTILLIGLPEGGKLPAEAADAEAVVFALKTRSIQASEAVKQSLSAARFLRSAGCRHLYFKYCSTFDSTDAGNIGPVADALLDEVEDDFTIFCPAFPKNGRKIFNGYLFVGPVLLSESGMQNHPLTPMTDPNLVRVLQGQTRHKVGLIGFDAVNRGASAIRAEMQKLRGQGVRYAIVDAVDEDDLAAIGAAALDEGLVFATGGSGLGGGLALSLRNAESGTERAAMRFPKVQGPAAVIAGSCSSATLGQIEHFVKADKPFFRVEIGSLLAGKERVVAQALAWAKPRLGSEPLLIAASESPTAVAQHQQAHGREQVGHLIESALAEIARGLVSAGVRRLILAGGETSSAAVERLDVRALRIGPTIDPGVPWTFSLGNDPLALALKSGNFGAPDFFTSAFNKLPN